jgi:prepilin-type N-terminal cleavage/methylation domain-containing protein
MMPAALTRRSVMGRIEDLDRCPAEAGPVGQSGITLIEVLVAIFVMGIGLLALLTLFPLGALEMAQAIKDERTGVVAANAVALSEAGKDLVSRTFDFVIASLSNGSADLQVVAQLSEAYDDLAVQAGHLEVELEELQSLFPPPIVQRHVTPLLAQVRSIKQRAGTLVKLLSLVRSEEK